MFFIGIEFAFAGAKIIKLSGDVKVRRGVEENWQPASVAMLLEDIDTIMAGIDGHVILQTAEGITFELGNNSILDVSDLRKITEKELFLFLMSKKVQNIEPREGKTKLRIGNVSVVHGESKAETEKISDNKLKTKLMVQEKNGARALYEQELYPNTIIKFHKILDKYDEAQKNGDVYLYLGRSFEAMNHPGQAIDAYQSAIDHYQTEDRHKADAQQAIDRLKSKK